MPRQGRVRASAYSERVSSPAGHSNNSDGEPGQAQEDGKQAKARGDAVRRICRAPCPQKLTWPPHLPNSELSFAPFLQAERLPRLFVEMNRWLGMVLLTGGRLTHVVAGVGTRGTITGLGRRLKEHDPHIRVVCILPEAFPGRLGAQAARARAGYCAGILDETIIDERVPVTVDETYAMCQHSRGLRTVIRRAEYAVAVNHLPSDSLGPRKGLSHGTIPVAR